MIKIDSTNFGSITVDGRQYNSDIIIINDTVEPAETERRHLFSKEELYKLLESNPEVIIVGIGQDSAMGISPPVLEIARSKGVEFIALPTPEAIKKFNQEGRKKAAYFHVTC